MRARVCSHEHLDTSLLLLVQSRDAITGYRPFLVPASVVALVAGAEVSKNKT
jgi:hypothetical protein